MEEAITCRIDQTSVSNRVGLSLERVERTVPRSLYSSEAHGLELRDCFRASFLARLIACHVVC